MLLGSTGTCPRESRKRPRPQTCWLTASDEPLNIAGLVLPGILRVPTEASRGPQRHRRTAPDPKASYCARGLPRTPLENSVGKRKRRGRPSPHRQSSDRGLRSTTAARARLPASQGARWSRARRSERASSTPSGRQVELYCPDRPASRQSRSCQVRLSHRRTSTLSIAGTLHTA